MHDCRVGGSPLVSGQVVYLHDCRVKGRHKIKDVWSSKLYLVVRSPGEGGSVYTIASLGDLTNTKQVHQSLLKVHVQAEPRTGAPVETPVEEVIFSPSEREAEMGDWCLWVVEALGAPVEVPGGEVIRRTTRATAGQHSNIHYLLQAVRAAVNNRGGPQDASLLSMVGLFRPRPWS